MPRGENGPVATRARAAAAAGSASVSRLPLYMRLRSSYSEGCLSLAKRAYLHVFTMYYSCTAVCRGCPIFMPEFLGLLCHPSTHPPIDQCRRRCSPVADLRAGAPGRRTDGQSARPTSAATAATAAGRSGGQLCYVCRPTHFQVREARQRSRECGACFGRATC